MKKLAFLSIAIFLVCFCSAQDPSGEQTSGEDVKYFDEKTIVTTSICAEVYTYYDPEKKEYIAPADEEKKKLEDECARIVKECDGQMPCISNLDMPLADLIRKRPSKPGVKPISDDVYFIIRGLLARLGIQVKKEGLNVAVIVMDKNKVVYKRVLKKSSNAFFASAPVIKRTINVTAIKRYNKSRTFLNKKAAVKGIFDGMSFNVSLKLKG